MKKLEMQIKEIIKRLESLSDPDAVKGMAKFGITAKSVYGVSIPNLRKMAKEIGENHMLAQGLWEWENRETRILAGMIEDPQMVTEEQMEKWVKDFDSWEVCDQCCMNLFEKTPFSYQKAVQWASHEEEFVKRAGFVMMARLAVSDKKAEDGRFVKFFPLIKEGSRDNRNFVKKAVNWALRQIGKRNLSLNPRAIELAEEIHTLDSKGAKWIASDALRELKSEAVQNRLKSRGGRSA